MNIFFGQNEDFEVAGLSFGITNKDDLFDVFFYISRYTKKYLTKFAENGSRHFQTFYKYS